MQKLLILIAILIGHIFAYFDSRPNFDDTGVLAVSIAISSRDPGISVPTPTLDLGAAPSAFGFRSTV